MKRIHKGFTLVELLIVVAILGVLATMMTMSSTDAVDSAGANAILSNLDSLRTAAYQMYVNEDFGMMTITFDGVGTPTGGTADNTVGNKLKAYLGSKASLITSSYGLVGSPTEGWYVVYKFTDATDTKGVKAKLAASAEKVELYGGSTAAPVITDFAAASRVYYGQGSDGEALEDISTHKSVALKVR